MNDDLVVERGAQAGWALGRALKDVFPDRSKIAIEAAIEALKKLLEADS